MLERHRLNAARFAGAGTPHYESWFQRANHPTRPLAFWIRYTVFAPADDTREACGELWAMFFDGESGEVIARKRDVPLAACRFSREALDVRIDDATLDATGCTGQVDEVAWKLRYRSPHPPSLMLPARLYDSGFPKAKLLTGSPLAPYKGVLRIGDRTVEVDGWVGSQNHNWGSRHTDRYAWGQVAGFDDAPDVFLECATAQLRLGPLWSPPLTVATVRVGAREWTRVGMLQAVRAKAEVGETSWHFRSGQIEARFEAQTSDFVALRYRNPPGGDKVCLNSKLARCTLTVHDDGEAQTFETRHRAAFELLRDSTMPGLPLQF